MVPHLPVTFPVSQTDLDGWVLSCRDAYADLTRAESLLNAGEVYSARQDLHSAREEMWHTQQSLIRAGAERPQDTPTVPLALLNTPASRRLAKALQEVTDAARAVDEERGQVYTRRTHRLLALLAEAETETFGPAGTGNGEG